MLIKKHHPTQITIDSRTFDTIWRVKEAFRKLVGGKVTWDSFLEQAALSLEAEFLLPSVKAVRYNPYIYSAECPSCRVEKYPLRKIGLRGRYRLAWRIKCSGCGKEYVALG